MRAVICEEYGSPENLTVKEVPAPTVGPGEVNIRVRAAGVNYPEVLIVQGKYQFKPPPPFIPGGEVAGVVVEVGIGVDHVKPGDAVLARMIFGGFAEQVVVGADAVIPLPDGIDPEIASGFVLTYATSYYALVDRAALQAGETLLVLGAAGGVGLAAVELGKLMGARVIAAASSDDKLELCKKYGADEVVNYSAENLKDRVKSLGGADVVYDPVGGAYSEAALRTLNWGGRHLVIGFAAGEIPKIPLNLTLLKSCQIVGVFWGAFTARQPERFGEHVDKLLGWLKDGTLKPHVSVRLPLDCAAEAVMLLMDRKAQGKIVLTL